LNTIGRIGIASRPMGMNFSILGHESFQLENFFLQSRNGRPFLFQQGSLAHIVGFFARRLGVRRRKGFGGRYKPFPSRQEIFVNAGMQVFSLSICQDHCAISLLTTVPVMKCVECVCSGLLSCRSVQYAADDVHNLGDSQQQQPIHHARSFFQISQTPQADS
jgi:hypothetical protein